MAGSIPDRLEELLVGCVRELGFDVEEIVLTPAGKHRVLRISVDHDRGVSIDDIAVVTRAVSDMLDGSDVMGSMPYTLEVSSRGADTPLTLPRHWRRNKDRLVAVRRTDGTEVSGRITDSGPRVVDLATTAGPCTVAFCDIDNALVEVELKRRDG